MRRVCLLPVAVAIILTMTGLSPRLALAQQVPDSTEPPPLLAPTGQNRRGGAPKPELPRTRVLEEAKDSLTRAATYTDELLDELSDSAAIGWPAAAVAMLLGGALLAYGWALFRNLFLPVCAVVGLATGSSVAAAVVLSAMQDVSPALRQLSLLVGASAGTVIYLVIAAKARPIACIMVIAAPFLILAALLLPLGSTGSVLALAAIVLALAMGFGSVIKLRPLAIVSTAVLGAVCLAVWWGLLSHLCEISFIDRSSRWAMSHPWALIVVVACLAALGISFQLNLGPGGAETWSERPPAERGG